MTSLEAVVNKLFEEQPTLSEDEAIIKLKGMKDDAGKTRWKTNTIRNRIEMHRKQKEIEKGVDATQSSSSAPEPALSPATVEKTDADAPMPDKSNEPAVETKEAPSGGTQLKTEGQQLSKTPTDPFKSPPTSQEIDEKLKSMESKVATVCTNLKKEVVDLVSTLKNDMKSALTDTVTQLRHDVLEALPQYEPEEKYTEIKLRQSTADALVDYCSANEFKESSEAIENLIASREDYVKIKEPYQHLVELAKKSVKGIFLRVYFENEQVSFEKLKRGLGISRKNIIIGISIGIGIGIVIACIINLATGCLCPTDIVPP